MAMASQAEAAGAKTDLRTEKLIGGECYSAGRPESTGSRVFPVPARGMAAGASVDAGPEGATAHPRTGPPTRLTDAHIGDSLTIMKKVKAYTSPLRAEQAAATRQRILAGLAEVLSTGDAQDASYRAIAGAAGVTEITVYRHFPNKDELLRAFWWWLDAQLTDRGMPRTERALGPDVRALFAAFDRHEPLIRASLLSPQGRAMRASMNAERQAGFRAALAGATRGLDAATRQRAHAAVQLLFSGYAWLSMKDQWGLSGQESGEAAAWAIDLILDHLNHRRRVRTRRKERAP